MSFNEEIDRSTDPTVVEYAVRELFKNKGPAAASRFTAKKLSGQENPFLGPGVTVIDPASLEGALWSRLVEHAVSGMAHMKPGFEHVAIGATVNQFYLKKKDEEMLRRLVAERLRLL